MPVLDLTQREIAILLDVLEDVAEAIDDGDRPNLDAADVALLLEKVRDAK